MAGMASVIAMLRTTTFIHAISFLLVLRDRDNYSLPADLIHPDSPPFVSVDTWQFMLSSRVRLKIFNLILVVWSDTIKNA
jgi:hypothetical protein